MTSAYDRFIYQLNSHGREYGDGFDKSHFFGITHSELVQAKSLLKEKALNGDTIAINAASLLDRDWYLPILDEVISTVGDKPAICEAAFLAFRCTGDKKYLDFLISLLDGADQETKWLCVQNLSSLEVFDEKLIDALSKIVVEDGDEVLRHSAGKRLLLLYGMKHESPEYNLAIRSMISEDKDIREETLNRIKK